ncbi:MAG: hypothetical protein KDB08_02390 [Microthrixaceae bacterium]|nr:hypothetical protein [Microthrixaceae bacterium]
MRFRTAPLALAAVLIAGLAGCALPAAPEEASRIAPEEEGSAELSPGDLVMLAAMQDGFLGSGTLQLGEQDWLMPDEVMLSYEHAVRVDGVAFACSGGAKVRAGYTLRVDSSWLGDESVEIECDGAPNTISLSDPVSGVTAVKFTATLLEGDGAVLIAIAAGEAGDVER